MRLLSLLRLFAADRRANTAMIFALSLPLLVGMSGLGVETGYWYFKQREPRRSPGPSRSAVAANPKR
jgi:Flp pilus assembly protein TadG